jgi:subtilisin family serine protease
MTSTSHRQFRIFGILSFAFLLLLLMTALVGAQTPNPKKPKAESFKGKKVVAGQVLVKFRQATSAQNIDQAKQIIDADMDRKVGKSGIRLLRSRSKDTTTLIRELSMRADVAYVEPNYVISVSSAPNDSSFSQVWGLQNTGQTVGSSAGVAGADISAMAAWELSTGSRQNVVAVIDTGVDYRHPDLAANMWSAPAPFTVNIGGQIIRCEAGTHGFDAITKTCDPIDEYNHGTHVAGTIGAVGNNGVGITGVNQTASMMAIKFMDATGSGTLADAIDAIDFAIQAKQALGAGANIRVLSNSWGWNGEPSQALLDEINRANMSNMLFVAGAGNGGDDYASDNNDVSPFYPASYDAPNLIAVAATDNKDLLASFSNYSPTHVHLGAPGVLVLSTILGGSYDWWSGTSMATPHVAGAAALVLSRCSLDTAALKTNILNNVDQIGSLSGITTTGGRLNVNKALRSCSNLSAPPTIRLTNPYDGMTYPTYSSVVLQAEASDSDGVVSKVDYYVDGKLIDTATTSPYTAHWYAIEVGEYTLTGVATDNSGLTTTSSPLKITINETIIPEPDPTPGACTTNIAASSSGATASASSEAAAGYAATGVNDGNHTGANWGKGAGWNDGTAGTFPDVVTVNLGAVKSISEIDVYSLQDNYASPVEPTDTMTFNYYGLVDFRVQMSTGTGWVDVPGGHITGNNLVKRRITFGTSISTDKIRVVVNNTADGVYSRVVEIEAFSCNAAPTPTPAPSPGTCLTNVAASSYGSTASASSEISQNYATSGAIDGNHTGTGWGTGVGWNDATAGAYPDYLIVNFGVNQPLSEVVVYSLQDNYGSPSEPTDAMTFNYYGLIDFQIQIPDGRGGWVDVPGGNIKGNNLVKRKIVFATPLVTDRIRVLVNSTADGVFSRIVEVEAFSCNP